MTCSTCGFTHNCICSHQPHVSSRIEFALLYHENERHKLTNTGKLISNSLPSSTAYTWQRKEPPLDLINKINQTDTETWLLFPSTDSISSHDFQHHHDSTKKQLFVILDATWQEAKKMVNKSPWLKTLPCLEIQTDETSRYHLRRNQNEGNLCTCEAGIEVLMMVKEPENAQALSSYYDQFLTVFQAERSGHKFMS